MVNLRFKRIALAFVVIFIPICLCACTKSASASEQTTQEASSVSTSAEDTASVTTENTTIESVASESATTESENPNESTEDDADFPEAPDVNKKLLSVEITLPASYMSNTDMTNFDPDKYASENGFDSAKLNDDGSITIQMSRSKHSELMKTMADGIEDTCKSLVKGSDTPYILSVDHNKDFTEYTVVVDKAQYENAVDMTTLQLVILSGYYFAFNGDTGKSVVVNMVDNKTKEVLYTYDTSKLKDDE
jgi:hypothetical protein